MNFFELLRTVFGVTFVLRILLSAEFLFRFVSCHDDKNQSSPYFLFHDVSNSSFPIFSKLTTGRLSRSEKRSGFGCRTKRLFHQVSLLIG
jgi:hypothetical protein